MYFIDSSNTHCIIIHQDPEIEHVLGKYSIFLCKADEVCKLGHHFIVLKLMADNTKNVKQRLSAAPFQH